MSSTSPDGAPHWDAAELGDTWAEVYDEVHGHLAADAQQAVDFLLARRPDRGRVLELGVGTGRLAIPLANEGFTVTGLDASPRMLGALAAKPGGERITVVLGDMTRPPVEGPFDVVLIAFNTLFALPDQDAQAASLAAAGRLLDAGGEVVVEAAVPRPWMITGEPTGGEAVDGKVAVEVADHDPVSQTVRSARVVISDTAGIRALPLRMRYAWPSEIDLMARLAGLGRNGRWGGWCGEPFDADATRHVSSYRADHRPPEVPVSHQMRGKARDAR